MESAIISSAILLANICILGLNLKLYTEYFKDKAQDGRSKKQEAHNGKG